MWDLNAGVLRKREYDVMILLQLILNPAAFDLGLQREEPMSNVTEVEKWAWEVIGWSVRRVD